MGRQCVNDGVNEMQMKTDIGNETTYWTKQDKKTARSICRWFRDREKLDKL